MKDEFDFEGSDGDNNEKDQHDEFAFTEPAPAPPSHSQASSSVSSTTTQRSRNTFASRASSTTTRSSAANSSPTLSKQGSHSVSSRATTPASSARIGSPAASAASTRTAASSSHDDNGVSCSQSASTTTGTTPKRGRTRNQRLRAKGVDPTTSSQHDASPAASSTASSSVAHRVRFSLQDDDNDSKQEASSVASSLRRHGRKRYRSKLADNWGETDDNETTTTTTLASTTMATTQQPPLMVRGAGSMNVHAVQDSARASALADECLYLCTAATLESATANCAATTVNRSSVQAALELVGILTIPKNRQTLWSIQQTTADPLQAILQVLGQVPDWYSSSSSNTNVARGGTSRTKSQRQAAAASAANSTTSTSVDSGRSSVLLLHTTAAATTATMQYSLQFQEALSMVAHYVSLDCTLSATGSNTKTGRVARRIRKTILTHGAAVQGILHLILADPVTDHLRGRLLPTDVVASCVAPSFGSPVVSIHVREEEASVASSVGDSLSIASQGDTPNSQSSSGSADPTLAGRRRRKQRRLDLDAGTLDSIPEYGKGGRRAKKAPPSQLSFTSSSSPGTRGGPGNSPASTDSHVVKIREQLDRVKCLVLKNTDYQVVCEHSCNTEEDGATSGIALAALSRIIAGKNEQDEKSCIDGEDDEPGANDDEDDCNPLLQTNRLLGESGATPCMAQAMADTLAAVTQQVSAVSTDPALCGGCLHYLQDRVIKLASLVDGACLFNEGNRRLFCQEGFTTESNGYLVVGLVVALKSLCDGQELFVEGALGEIGLTILRTLTSLTHENEVAAQELEMPLLASASGAANRGLDALTQALKAAVDEDWPRSTDKLRYDAVIFCLNTLTNVVESGGTRKTFAEMVVPGSDGNEPFLAWLSRWLVSQTTSFRDAVIGSTFGSSPSKHASRQLDSQEDERLVTAGNGFVFLACLMIDGGGDNSADSAATSKIRDLVLAELPGDNGDASLTFVKNSLKAFCNFYHYSVGDLSVAVVAPVKKLIEQLEAIQVEIRRPPVVDDTSTVASTVSRASP